MQPMIRVTKVDLLLDCEIRPENMAGVAREQENEWNGSGYLEIVANQFLFDWAKI